MPRLRSFPGERLCRRPAAAHSPRKSQKFSPTSIHSPAATGPADTVSLSFRIPTGLHHRSGMSADRRTSNERRKMRLSAEQPLRRVGIFPSAVGAFAERGSVSRSTPEFQNGTANSKRLWLAPSLRAFLPLIGVRTALVPDCEPFQHWQPGIYCERRCRW